jgi:hypothetical protein
MLNWLTSKNYQPPYESVGGWGICTYWVDARLSVSLLASFVVYKNPKTTLVQWWVSNLFLFYWSSICHEMIGVHIDNFPCRFCGNILLRGKKKIKNSNCTFYVLMKMWSNSNHWKVHNYHLVKVFMRRIFYLNFSSLYYNLWLVIITNL